MKRLVLPEGGDERVRRAALRIEAEGFGKVIIFEKAPEDRVEHYAKLYLTGRPDASRLPHLVNNAG